MSTTIYLTGEQVCALLSAIDTSLGRYSSESDRHKRELAKIKSKLTPLEEAANG